jgi:hypothetical protein
LGRSLVFWSSKNQNSCIFNHWSRIHSHR